MSVSNKLSAIGKPRPDNLPVHFLAFKILRLRDDACLACRDELDAHPLRVTVCQVFAIGRNCPGQDSILERICGELAKLQLWCRLLGGRFELSKPENCASDRQCSDDNGCHCPRLCPVPRRSLLS